MEASGRTPGVTHVDVPSVRFPGETEEAMQNPLYSSTCNPLVGCLMQATKGPLKGYQGLVKSVNERDGTAQMEIEALLDKRTVPIAVDYLQAAQASSWPVEHANADQHLRDSVQEQTAQPRFSCLSEEPTRDVKDFKLDITVNTSTRLSNAYHEGLTPFKPSAESELSEKKVSQHDASVSTSGICALNSESCVAN